MYAKERLWVEKKIGIWVNKNKQKTQNNIMFSAWNFVKLVTANVTATHSKVIKHDNNCEIVTVMWEQRIRKKCKCGIAKVNVRQGWPWIIIIIRLFWKRRLLPRLPKAKCLPQGRRHFIQDLTRPLVEIFNWPVYSPMGIGASFLVVGYPSKTTNSGKDTGIWIPLQRYFEFRTRIG